MPFDNIECVKNYVDLESYSTSANFVGYFAHMNRSDVTSSDIVYALDYFTSFFQSNSLKFDLVSLLVTDPEELVGTYNLEISIIEKFLKPLEVKGWLKFTDYGEHFDNDSWSKLITNFRAFPNCSYENLNLISRAVMEIPGIKGHCFFVNPDEELIVYPHEDVGFGILTSESNKDRSLAQLFIKSMNNEKFIKELV